MGEILQIACVVSFWVKVPMLLVVRARSAAPWWFVIIAATVLGWLLSNATVYLGHIGVDEHRRQDTSCTTHGMPAPVTTQKGISERAVACGLNDYWRESYRPLTGLLYGPFYLLCCSLPYWLIFGRHSSVRLARRMALLGAAAFSIEWIIIVGEGLRRGDLEEMLMNADPFVWPPLTIAVAFATSWIVAAKVIQRFDSRGQD